MIRASDSTLQYDITITSKSPSKAEPISSSLEFLEDILWRQHVVSISYCAAHASERIICWVEVKHTTKHIESSEDLEKDWEAIELCWCCFQQYENFVRKCNSNQEICIISNEMIQLILSIWVFDFIFFLSLNFRRSKLLV